MIWTKGRQPEKSGHYSIIYKSKSGIKGVMGYIHYSKKHDAWNTYDYDSKGKGFEKHGFEVLAYADGDYEEELIREVLGDERNETRGR